MSRLSLGCLSLIGTLSLLFTSPVKAQGNCEPQLNLDSGFARIYYDPIQDHGVAKTMSINVHNAGKSACNLNVTAEVVSGSFRLIRDGGSEVINYHVYDKNSGREFRPVNDVSSIFSVKLNGNVKDAKFNFEIIINNSDILQAGIYRQDLVFKMIDANNDTVRYINVPLEIEVVASTLIGLKGDFQRSGSTAVLNLGELVEGSRPLMTTLYVQSSTGYKISVVSENKGRMRQGNSDWYVDYRLKVGKNSVNLRNQDTISITSNRPLFDNYPLSIDIGNTVGRRAGLYTDTITFLVEAF